MFIQFRTLCFAVMSLMFLGNEAHAVLALRGPVDPAHGFPKWYKDTRGLRLALCLDHGPICGPLEDVDPNLPVSFPNNFPGEAFWWSTETTANVGNNGEVLLVYAMEAAFANEIPRAGDRVSFGRVRIRSEGLPLGTYRIQHPYGSKTFRVTNTVGRQINDTEDIGLSPERFDGALRSNIGPFLRWDPAFAPAAPEGYVGDPQVPHRIIGSPIGRNLLRVQRLSGGVFRTVATQRLFNVLGKLATGPEEPVLAITPRGGILRGANRSVTVTSSVPAEIFYTLDGSNPLTSSTRQLYTGPIAINDCAGLRFAASNNGAASEVSSENYVVIP